MSKKIDLKQPPDRRKGNVFDSSPDAVSRIINEDANRFRKARDLFTETFQSLSIREVNRLRGDIRSVFRKLN